MTKKLTRLEAFQELSIQLARIEHKLDKLLSYEETGIKPSKEAKLPNISKEEIRTLFDELVPKDIFVDLGYPQLNPYWEAPKEWHVEFRPKINPDPSYTQCYFDLHPGDRFKPISVSCPCKRCSAYSMSGGSIQSVGSDAWNVSTETRTNTITGKLQE